MDDFTTLILVRHAETQWNRAGRCQGQQPGELSPRGEEQAQRLAERLAGVSVQAIYSSDLRRAWQCAEAIAHGMDLRPAPGLGSAGCKVAPCAPLEPQPSPQLRERNFGVLEGLTPAEALARWPGWFRAWQAAGRTGAPPGGESILELAHRVATFVLEVLEQWRGKTVITVTHGGPIRVLVCHLLEASLARRGRIRIDNGSLTLIRGNRQQQRLLALNDVSHLYAHSPVPVLGALAEKVPE